MVQEEIVQHEEQSFADFVDNTNSTRKSKLQIIPNPPNDKPTIEYREFILDKVTYPIGACIEVMGALGVRGKPYIGEILKIESLPRDNRNVWVTVQWYYWAEECLGGRKPWQGDWELLKTDHIDVVHVSSIIGLTPVAHYTEEGDEAPLVGFYWRQTYSIKDGRANGKLKRYCHCNGPYNPDSEIYQCDECQQWIHENCVLEAKHELPQDDQPWTCPSCHAQANGLQPPKKKKKKAKRN